MRTWHGFSAADNAGVSAPVRAAAVVILLVAACLAFFNPPLAAQEKAEEIRPPKLDYTTHKLVNGLQVILLEDHEVPIINLQVWYHVVSKDEQPGHTGFAHLFEHLMFKGSAHVAAEEHSR
ncbi:MAG: insulinase family protein, partial [Candidatus Acidiferrales bacterium]